MPPPNPPSTEAEREFIKDVRVFVRGDQLPLLARVLANMAREHEVPRRRAPCLLWHGGLTMRQIEKQLCFWPKECARAKGRKRCSE